MGSWVRLLRASTAGAVGVSSLAWFLLPVGSASADTFFEASASSLGVQGTIYNSSFPLGLTAELNMPYTAARLNALQQSDALASSVYPGDTVAGLPGIAGVLFGFTVPPYPVQVATAYGDRPKDNDLPGLSMHAESGISNAISSAQVGNATSGLTSTTRVDEMQDESVRSTAASTGDGLLLGNVLTLSQFQTYAEATAAGASGDLTRASSISVGRIYAPGLRYGLPCETPSNIPLPNPIPGLPQPPPLTAPGTPIPAPFGCNTLEAPDIGFRDGLFTVTVPAQEGPMTFPVPADSVIQAFKAAGVEISYQAPTTLTKGIRGAGLTFKMTLPAGPENPYFQGPTPVTFTLGSGTALVDLSPVALDTGSSGVGGGSFGGAASPQSPGSITDQIGLPGVIGLPSTDLAGAGAVPGSDTPVVGSSDLVAQPTAAVVRGVDLGNLYLALVAAATVALAAAVLLRSLGVRFLWS